MNVLNGETLAGAIKHCTDYPGYFVVVVISDQSRLHAFIHSMRDQFWDDIYQGLFNISRAGIIKFTNGSIIRPILANSKARGVCAHEILYDDVKEGEITVQINTRVYQCNEIERNALDDFLNSFKIV